MSKYLPKWALNLYHLGMAGLGAVLYFFPSQKLVVVGVTGTNGKSTTVLMLSEILRKAGFRVAESSSIHFQIAGRQTPNLMKQTMPGRFFLQWFLREAVKSSCQFAIIEVTSEGIRQHRHRFINWDGVVLTNLAPEHIESHGSFEAYKKAKIDFFRAVAQGRPKYLFGKIIKKFFVINKEMKEVGEFLNFPDVEKIIFNPNDWVGLKLKLLGHFFLVNAAAALSCAKQLGINSKIGLEALSELDIIPGRMEEIKNSFGFRVFVDYAHTPNALESVYQTLKDLRGEDQGSSKIICILGSAGGGRDKWKRPEFGRIASAYCDEIILTNEDPYDEDPSAILNQIKSGIAGDRANVQIILDRKEAIAMAIYLASNGDIVVITGKGSEPWMMLEKGKKIPWDDRRVVKEILDEKKTF